MSQSLSHLIVHAVFSTKDRRPFLHSEDIRIETYASLSTNVISGNNAPHSAALSGRFSRGRPPRAEALGYSLFALRATPKCPLGIFLCVLQSRCGRYKASKLQGRSLARPERRGANLSTPVPRAEQTCGERNRCKSVGDDGLGIFPWPFPSSVRSNPAFGRWRIKP